MKAATMSIGATCTLLRKLFKTRERSHYLVKEKVPGSECGIGAAVRRVDR